MTEKNTSSRTQTHEVEIDASPEAVWKALNDDQELTRWLFEEAKVEPGKGGKRWISWGQGQEMEEHHEEWKPGELLRLVPPPGTEPWMVEEWHIEQRGKKTVLRLVFSGIPEGDDWDAMYDGTDVGWQMFLEAARHYLEHHQGKPRRTVFRYAGLPRSKEEVFESFCGKEGLCAGGDNATLAAGGRYAWKTSSGLALEGHVLIHQPGRSLVLTAENLDNSLLALTFHTTGEGSYTNFIFSTYGMPDSEFGSVEQKLVEVLDRILPLPQETGAAVESS